MKDRFEKSEHDTTNKVKKIFKKKKGWFGKKLQKSSAKNFDLSTLINLGDITVKAHEAW
jgi:hypothetical protein